MEPKAACYDIHSPTMPGPTITARGQHTERASAEHAALTISIDAEDDGSSAVKTVQGIVSDLAALLQRLAPGLPPLNGTAKTSHPSPEAAVESTQSRVSA